MHPEPRAEWPDFADRRIRLTDYSILSIVKIYCDLGINCEILTTENDLAVEVETIPIREVEKRRRRD
jgi:hypothetical protein